MLISPNTICLVAKSRAVNCSRPGSSVHGISTVGIFLPLLEGKTIVSGWQIASSTFFLGVYKRGSTTCIYVVEIPRHSSYCMYRSVSWTCLPHLTYIVDVCKCYLFCGLSYLNLLKFTLGCSGSLLWAPAFPSCGERGLL